MSWARGEERRAALMWAEALLGSGTPIIEGERARRFSCALKDD